MGLFTDSSTSTSLLVEVSRGDSESWREFCDRYTPVVYSWCRSLGVSQNDAPDIAQEVFRAVYRRIATFRKSAPGQSFRGWLYTITRNKVRDAYRAAVRRESAPGGSTAQQLLQSLEDKSFAETSSDERNTHIMELLAVVEADFEAPTWQAFWRTAVDGIPTAVVAEELGLSVNAIRLAKSRVLRKLRETLGNHGK